MIGYLIIPFLAWRVWLFFIAGIGGKFTPFTPSFPYSDIFLIPSGLPNWIWSFANFDGVHYLTIAKSGYSAQFTQVFFPLYPLLIKIINLSFPLLNPVITGLAISNIFFLLALAVFWKLLRFDYSEIQVKWMILFLIAFPLSFFFGSLYTESPFLFFVLASFYAARQKKWWLAGIFGALASNTRLVGIFLLPALIWEWHETKLKAPFDYAQGRQSSKLKTTAQKLKLSDYYNKVLHFTLYTLHSPILYTVPIGLLAYMFYLQIRFGDWLYFWHVQPVFGAERSGGQLILLPQVVWRYIKILISIPRSQEIFWTSLTELIASLLSFSLLIAAYVKKVRLSYLIFSWLAVITPTLTGTFSSMPRYVLVAFPIFIVLGLIKNKLVRVVLFFTFFFSLSIFTLLFTRGHWIA